MRSTGPLGATNQAEFENEAAILATAQAELRAALEAHANELGVSIKELTLEQKWPIRDKHPLPEYNTQVIPAPSTEPDPDIPLRLSWTNGSREYDVCMEDGLSPGEGAVAELWHELRQDDIDAERRWSVIDRGLGRLNILPPLQVPRHEHVAEVVMRVLVNNTPGS